MTHMHKKRLKDEEMFVAFVASDWSEGRQTSPLSELSRGRELKVEG